MIVNLSMDTFFTFFTHLFIFYIKFIVSNADFLIWFKSLIKIVNIV